MLAKVTRINAKFAVIIAAALLVLVVGVIQIRRNTSELGADKNVLATQSQAETMPETTKTEVSPESMVAPPAVPQSVTQAEQQMPAASTPAYENACEQLKGMYEAEMNRNVAAENSTYSVNQQAIINRYSQDGMSFSKMEKNEQAKELRRHNAMLDQIQKQYSRQRASISC